jgi:hypothetical protein
MLSREHEKSRQANGAWCAERPRIDPVKQAAQCCDCNGTPSTVAVAPSTIGSSAS